jgi:hypothetical protein
MMSTWKRQLNAVECVIFHVQGKAQGADNGETIGKACNADLRMKNRANRCITYLPKRRLYERR